jgi:ATP-dependent DNA helicase RecG
METQELLSIIANGEDSTHQFKANINNANAIASEMTAFSNSRGGQILIGVHNDGSIAGLSNIVIGEISKLIANAATNNIKPAINPISQNFALPNGVVLVLTIEPGLNKPYMDSQGYIWVKTASDKRRVTAREELQRMFQEAALVHSDEIPVPGTSVADVDREFLSRFLKKLSVSL